MSWQALAPLTPPAALMSETASPTPATAGGPMKARLPVSGRMPPTLNESALVAPDAHLSFVNAAVEGDADVDADVDVLAEDVLSVSVAPPELESLPQAARDSPRAAPRATVADSRLYRRVAVVDRFTL